MKVLVNGVEYPVQEGSIDIDDAIGQRSTASFAVVDKAADFEFKRGQNVDILHIQGELDSNPETLKTDFANKVQGSSTENPNELNYSNVSSLPNPELINKKHSQAALDKIKTLNADLLTYSTSTVGAIAAEMFSFNMAELVKRRYGFTPTLNWLRGNIESFKANWHGKGANKWGNAKSTADFANKVTASTTANPHMSRQHAATSIPSTPKTSGTEATQAQYDAIKAAGGTNFMTTTTTNVYRAIQYFSFDLIAHFKKVYGFDVPGADVAARVTWLRANVKRMIFNHIGYGIKPNGNEVFLHVLRSGGFSSYPNFHLGYHYSATNALSQFGVSPVDIQSATGAIDSTGFVHFAAAAPASNGTLPSQVYTDHVYLDIAFETGKEKASFSVFKNTSWSDTVTSDVKDSLDLTGKVRASLTANPHIVRGGSGAQLSNVTASPFTEISQADYDKMKSLDGQLASVSTLSATDLPQQTFSFDVLKHVERKYGAIPGATTAEKVDWLRLYATKARFRWFGFGSSPAGFKANLAYRQGITGSWLSSATSVYTHSFNYVSELYIESSADNLQAFVDDAGYAHFVAYCSNKGDGVTASVINTDHAFLELEVENPAGNSVSKFTISMSDDIPVYSDGFIHVLAAAEATVYTNGPSTINTDYIDFEFRLKPNFIPPGSRLFGGVIERPLTKDINLAREFKIHSITCADWHYLADKRIVAKVYRGMYAGDIVRDIITNYLAEEGIEPGDIQTGPFVTEAVYNYIPATRCFESLAELAGFEWHIDDDKYLNYFSRSTFYAPVIITPTSQIRNIELEPSAEDYRNKQYIRAGRDVTDPITEQYKGDGATRTYTFPYDLAKEPVVKVDGVTKTVGIRGLEEGKDFYWNKGDKVVTQDDSATPLTATQTLTVIGQGFFDIVISSSNYSEIDKMKGIEGGSGLHENVLDDSSITSKQSAFETANAKLKRYSTMGNKLRFDTLIPNLKAGQLINVNLPTFKVNNTDYLIESVKAAELGTDDNRLVYQISCVDGAATGGWGDFFKKMAGNTGAVSIRENIQESESVIIMLNFSKTWTQGEGKNIFKDTYPKAGLYPLTSLFPGFDDDDRVKYVSFFDANNVELFRKSVVKQTESTPGVIETTAIILPFEANGLPIKFVGWYGGDMATSSFGTGILLDKQSFDRVKNDAESFQIVKTDTKGW